MSAAVSQCGVNGLVPVRAVCQDPPMDHVEVAEIAPGEYSLSLEAGTTDVDDLISELGHEPNGYFWEGIVELLLTTEAPTLEGRFSSDPEGGAFYATSNDRVALDDLAVLLRAVAADRNRLRQLMAFAEASGFEFDD
ncbi:Imm51 family immunity protein [Micromonospora sp. CA-259024]|uniref:Imm51 family immunity protein n=1 Tax=Micromonospora sp. CA-259024 TaxID=3239965 RepID=UPI003D8A8D7B